MRGNGHAKTALEFEKRGESKIRSFLPSFLPSFPPLSMYEDTTGDLKSGNVLQTYVHIITIVCITP